MNHKGRFTVYQGGRDRQVTVNTVILKIYQDSRSAIPVDVRIFEEDTFLVLTVDPVMRYTEEHPIRLMTGVMNARPNKPGTIITNNNSWYAVVHDLDAEPACRKEWIRKAYLAALTLADKKKIRRVGTPLLGSVHGRILPEESLAMLLAAVNSVSLHYLKIICILVPFSACESIWCHLRQAVAADSPDG